MSDNTDTTTDPAYVPQRGDRVRWSLWSDHIWVDVKHVEDGIVYGVDEDGDALGWKVAGISGHWVKVTPPPKRYIVVDDLFVIVGEA